jgi:hypothetical protein
VRFELLPAGAYKLMRLGGGPGWRETVTLSSDLEVRIPGE